MSQFLVIGASGFIGQHLMTHLAKDATSKVLGTSTQARAGLIQFDVAVDNIAAQLPSEWSNFFEPRWAILCAAVRSVDDCKTQADYARSVMLTGAQRCIKQLSEFGYRIVFPSTSYVFPDNPHGFVEHDEPKPINQYGVLKRELELFLEAEYPSTLIARLGKVVGDSPSDRHLLSDWHLRATRGDPIECIVGQVLEPTLVDDVVATIEIACRQGLTGTYHIANPEPTRRADLAMQFLRTCNLQAEVLTTTLEQLQLVEPRPLSSWLQSDKIQQELGVRFTSVATILSNYRAKMKTQNLFRN